MINKRNKIVAALTAAAMLASGSITASANEESSFNYDSVKITNRQFAGTINGDNSEGIKIDVYSYVLEEETDEYKQFRNVYDFSVYADENGEYSFNRPRGAFMMKVDLSSLPEKTGISSEIVHIGETANTTDLNVDYIDHITVGVDDIITEDVRVELYSESNQELYADYNTTINQIGVNKRISKVSDLSDIKDVNYSVTINANGIDYSDIYSITLSDDIIDKINELNYYGELSDRQKISLFSEEIRNDESLSFFEKSDIADEISDYFTENPSSKRSDDLSFTELRSLSDPTYVNEETYESANFCIHYENGEYSNSVLQAYASTLEGARNMYISNGFEAPLPFDGGTLYDVYLCYDSSADAAATTKHPKLNGNSFHGRSYIIFNAPTNYSSTNKNYTKTIAHELFHAVSYRYTYEENATPEKWFSESFANWAGLYYVGESTSSLKTKANLFLSNEKLSLHDITDDRNYGAFVFPLTIQQSYGGISTILNILEAFEDYAGTGDGISYKAISSGLSATNTNYNRSKAFVYCMVNNMFSQIYYPTICTGTYAWNDVHRTGSYTGNKTINNIVPAAMACRYYDFTPSSTSNNLYVTLQDMNNAYTNISIACVKQKTNGDYYRYSTGVGSSYVGSYYTYQFNNFSQSASTKFTIGLINSKTNATQTLKFTATYLS